MLSRSATLWTLEREARILPIAPPFSRSRRAALMIITMADHQLADEYNAAQERGEIAKVGQPSIVPDGNNKPATSADVGLSRKEIHDARQIRDAEKADPGIVKRVLNERVSAGQEPTKAALREAVVKAAALASYAKQAKDDELMRYATRVRDRAIRRAGELLKQIEPGHGRNQNITDGGGPNVLTRKDAGEAAGMSDRQIKTAIRVANVPAEDFEKQVESANPPTVTALAEQGKKPSVRPVIDLKGRDPGEHQGFTPKSEKLRLRSLATDCAAFWTAPPRP